ncbi:MAG: hypothetical protein HRU19_29090 [Pseudobacteriovorax sp.]|nr:hypothetical protein [Pseudobacteriovorax sp.]
MAIKRIFVPLVLVSLLAQTAYSFDPCRTFFWSGSRSVEFNGSFPYKTEYLTGVIPENTPISGIEGGRIVRMWKAQTERCLLSAEDYGLFSNSEYYKLDFASQIAFQIDSYNELKSLDIEHLYLFAKNNHLSGSLITINQVIGASKRLKTDIEEFESSLNLLTDETLTDEIKRIIIDDFCSQQNLDKLDEIESQCLESFDESCDLLDLFDAIQRCQSDNSNLDAIIQELNTSKDGLREVSDKNSVWLERLNNLSSSLSAIIGGQL